MSKRVAINIINAAKIYAPIKIEDLDEKRIVPKMMLRRRLTRNAKIMLYLADKCGFTGGKIVYGSAFGELQATVGITDAILNETSISPTLFQNSVYNSAPSYFSLLNGDKDEIITISSGMNTSRVALQTAALQALVSGERVLCVVTECLDINMIEDVKTCTSYLESGVAVVLEIAKDESGAVEIENVKEEGVIDSLQELMTLVLMSDKSKTKVFVSL
ncbi:beta-ketoacyl synthase chain length factor [Sulfurimonas sp. SAG-AH-194-C21]|nr:beta-ketoacyl synthase chain length factor [Sulfurimonas sp. SAG-AH-194-C21]MDF1884504.1 beta-ketoacyl synthase chain length factor [Sulfurimonas sp. SAG-AH-194-C21]